MITDGYRGYALALLLAIKGLGEQNYPATIVQTDHDARGATALGTLIGGIECIEPAQEVFKGVGDSFKTKP